MTRNYAIKYKSKSKIPSTAEAIKATEDIIMEDTLVKSAKISDDGQMVSVEVENEEDFAPVMNRVVNVFRKIDDKSEVSYKFGLN